jgi:hypothetical protein
MCYSERASINAFVIGMVSSFLLYKESINSGQKYKLFQKLALFFAFVTVMQIYDAIFWRSLKDNNGENKINFIFTKIAMITNHLQPIVLAFLIGSLFPLNDLSKMMLYSYIIVVGIYSIIAFNKISYTQVSKTSTPSLHWQWNTLDLENSIINPTFVYALFLATVCVICLQLPNPISYIMILINLSTFFFSKFKYKNTEIGRMWCHIAVYAPLFLLLLQKFI